MSRLANTFHDRSIATLASGAMEDREFWIKESPELDPDTGQVLRGGMWPHQKQFWELSNFIKVLVGGYGAGKTLIGSKRIISSALINAPCPVAAIGPSFPLARETSIATITDLLEGKVSLYGRRAFRWNYNATTKVFTITHGGRQGKIIVYSGDKPLSLRGPNLAAAWIDEPFIQDLEVFKQMIARVRHPQAKMREIFLTGTPEQLNWGYDLCMGHEEIGKYDVGFITASSRNNLALPEEYITTLAGAYSGKEADAYLDGMFVNLASGLVYHAFKQAENVVDDGSPDTPPIIPEGAELGAGMDFNVNPMSSCVFWKLGNRIHFFDEIELPNSDTEYLCSLLKERYPNLVDIYPDPAGRARKTSSPGGRTDYWYIREAGFRINAPPYHDNVRDSYNAVNGKLKNSMGTVTMTFSRQRCRKLIKYLNQYNYEEMNKQKEMSHLLDSMRYPISYLFPVYKLHMRTRKLIGV